MALEKARVRVGGEPGRQAWRPQLGAENGGQEGAATTSSADSIHAPRATPRGLLLLLEGWGACRLLREEGAAGRGSGGRAQRAACRKAGGAGLQL